MESPAASVHPADETLVWYGLGKLDDTLAESVGKHLKECDPCRRRVAQLSADSILERLQNAEPQQEANPPGPTPARTKTLVEAAPPSPAKGDVKRPVAAIPPASGGALPPELANHPQYEVIRELGRGGMGVVYLARNRLMNRLEVLKVLSKGMLAKPGRSDRFLQEIQSAARLHHPNVVAAYTAFPLGETLVFAMEYVEGDDLSKLVRARGPLPVLNACYFAYQTAQGLQHAHERGMIHRDIKPGNLILFREGKKGIVKILDFGLAKVTSEQGDDGALTQQGQMLGTPDYIAPEQTLDAQKADIRADIYSLGCTLYHLLTGSPPFRGNSLYQVLQAHHSVEARPLNLVRPEVPAELAAVAAKMMAKEPDRRYQTPAEVAQAIKPFLKPAGLAIPAVEISEIGPRKTQPAGSDGSERNPDDDALSPSLAPMEAVQPGERWKSLIDLPAFGHSSAIRKRAPRRAAWLWPTATIAGVLLAGLSIAWVTGALTAKAKEGLPGPPGESPGGLANGAIPAISSAVKPSTATPLNGGTDGFVSLLNGKDLTGWSTLEENGSQWNTGRGDGVLTGRGSGEPGGRAVLLSNRTDYANFQLKFRVLNSGDDDHNRQFFFRRCTSDDLSSGYSVKLGLRLNDADQGQPAPIGSIQKIIVGLPSNFRDAEAGPLSLPIGEWYQVEITAIGNHIVTAVNGIKAADYTDTNVCYPAGGLALFCAFDATLQIKEMQIKELPPTSEDPTVPRASATDESLQKAKARWQEARDKAREQFLNEFDYELGRLPAMVENAAKRVKLGSALERQRENFRRRGFLTWSSRMQDPRSRYIESVEAAQNELERAFDEAIATANDHHDEKTASALSVQKKIVLAPRVISICHCVMNGTRKWSFVLYSNHKVGLPDGPSSWTFDNDQLVFTIVADNSPPGGFIDTCTIAPDGASFSAANQFGATYTARFIER